MAPTLVTITCKHCHEPFTAAATYVKAQGRTYCTRMCASLGRTRPVADRLEDLSIYEPNSGCRLFLGSLDRDGYGHMTTKGKEEGAHRTAYREAVGYLDDGMELDHLCRNRACINHVHLEPVTHRENTLRGTAPVAIVRRTGVCMNGHKLQNVGVYTSGSRRACRACAIENSRRYRQRKAGATL